MALCDEKVTIRVAELPSSGKVKISASMILPWGNSIKYESFALFTADSSGTLDLSKQKPDSGSYDFPDSMGLIDSMRRVSGKLGDIVKNMTVSASIFIDIVAECGQDKASVRLKRLIKLPEVKNQAIADEFVGELFYTENSDNQTIIFIGGSGSGLAINAPLAAALASHGFNVLSVSYFGEKGLPDKLSEIPLEYFEKVFAWLSKNPITRGKEIQLFGMSKGAELSLLLASRYPFITKVAAMAPHAYCFQGLAFKAVSSWTCQGESVPFIQLKTRWLITNMISSMVKNKPFGFTHTYKKGLEAAKNKEDARIKVENAKADLLLFTTKQNNMWNSYDGCVQIMDTLRKNNYKQKYDLIVYEDAGEPYYVPYIIPVSESTAKMAPRLVLSMGGTLQGNSCARVDSWKKTIDFFKN